MTASKPDKCAFCKIVCGETKVDKVFEDKLILAFLHIVPLNKGHILVIPKEHYNGPTQMPATEWVHLMVQAAELAAASMRATKSDAYNLLVANGASAGQIAPHICVEVIPRLVDDGIAFPARSSGFEVQEEKERFNEKIRTRMSRFNEHENKL